MQIKFSAPPGFADFAADTQKRIATAATAAVTEAGNTALLEGRADILAAMNSRKWANALRLDVFPKGGTSVNAAAVLRHKIPYAGIFEDGGTISGNPFIWLPIEKNLPLQSAGQRWTPAKFVASQGPLVTIRRGGNRAPLLGGRVRVGQAGGVLALPPRGQRTRDKLARGSFAKAGTAILPLFVGIATVNISKRFHLHAIVARAAGALAELFAKHLKS